ncbi:hypothetical protein [Candidatus Venteria ishoeyi]|uniref:Uncharacterized protein n=1 Tax=Candidatus Venteria ishoeyi TaxID=1899563 RepID=A0A1H6F5X7_9GAMM|nr:hypothetical protein [Candidatus Venteria ishoeyi]MDM8546198.1 hypothetical protein [Candidatus Venteria ishoeyi]SEH04384.1 Uncharacterised protein [Candidatus Venteria ishoeyi]
MNIQILRQDLQNTVIQTFMPPLLHSGSLKTTTVNNLWQKVHSIKHSIAYLLLSVAVIYFFTLLFAFAAVAGGVILISVFLFKIFHLKSRKQCDEHLKYF